MVGYNKNDSLTSNQKIIAGIISGMITRFVTQPLDVIKLRTQLMDKKPGSSKLKWFRTTKSIIREEGVFAFWQGHTLGQIHSVIAVSTQFHVYEITTKFFTNADTKNEYTKLIFFTSGVLAGCTSATLVIPLEVIRVRQMLVKDQYKGLINGAKIVYKNGGILAFYEGLTASLCQMGPQVGVTFLVFSLLQPYILSWMEELDNREHKQTGNNLHKPEHLVMASSIAASASGFISKTVTYPFDLVKRRMQISSHKEDSRYKIPTTSKKLVRCERLPQCLVDTYKKDGMVGLFRGWKVTVYKAQLTSVIAFTSYELICHILRDIHV